MTVAAPPGHVQEPFEQHPRALTWRAVCACPDGRFVGLWRGSPDRAQEDVLAHWSGDDREGIRS